MKRIMIVTGASSGLGREFARQLSGTRKADEIWLVARRRDRLEELAAELAANRSEKPSLPAPRIIEADISGRAGVTRFAGLLDAEGPCVIDAFVNNAGFGTYGPFLDTSMERELDMIELNVTALTGLCHLAIPRMDRGSLLINVSSLASFIPLGNFAVYGATKAYVMSFSTALAAEIADAGIQAVTVCPGPVDTEFANVASNGARERVVDGKSPAKVVAHSLRCARRGKHFSIMAPKWKFKAFMSRFVGRYFFARWTYVHEKRPSRKEGL